MHSLDDTEGGQGTPSEPPGARKTCPACQSILQQGHLRHRFSQGARQAYLCTTCAAVYTLDLCLLGRVQDQIKEDV